ncbi:MAG: FtsQ-type POTRA domain-containing protein [Acidobacteriota bacterium]
MTLDGSTPRPGEVLPFRRRGRRRMVRRHPVLRWARPMSMAVAIVAAPTLAGWWLLASPTFEIAEAELRSSRVESVVSAALAVPEAASDTRPRVSAEWVERALEPLHGENLWRLDLRRAEEILRRHPWIASVAVSRRAPSTLVVRAVERREAALWRRPEALFYVDRDGRPISPWRPDDGAIDLPIVSTPAVRLEVAPNDAPLADALAVLEEIAAADAEWLVQVSEIEVLGGDDYRLHSRRLPFPVLVRAGEIGPKHRRLRELLPQLSGRWDIAAIDLRFARRIIVQPATDSPRES